MLRGVIKNHKDDEATIVTTIRLSPNQRARLREIAERDDRSVTYIVRRAVDELIERRAA